MTTGALDPARAGSCLSESVSATLAEMAFVDAIALPQGAASPGSGGPVATIDVLAPLSLRIELGFSDALRARIVSTLFAGEAAPGGAAGDAILEILNVIAGSFLSLYFGPGTPVSLSLPRYLRGAEAGEPVASVEFDAEGERASASVLSVRYRY